MTWITASLVAQFVLAAYSQAILWLPRGAWNDQPGQRIRPVAEKYPNYFARTSKTSPTTNTRRANPNIAKTSFHCRCLAC